MLLDISGKNAMSTAPASATSSSSQSSRLNWHPSHDANLNTPMRGFEFLVAFLELTMASHPAAQLRVTEHRSVLAQEVRAHLAVPAEAHRALHVEFHGQENLFVRYGPPAELPHDKAHHDLRAAGHRDGPIRPQLDELEQ